MSSYRRMRGWGTLGIVAHSDLLCPQVGFSASVQRPFSLVCEPGRVRLGGPAVVVAALLTSAAVLAGCRTAPDPAPNALHHIRESKTLRVCSTGDYRPFTYRDPQGAWSGMDIELADDVARRLDVKAEMVQTSWANLVDDLNARCDIAMGGISITLERAQDAVYSKPYLRDGKAAIVRCADASRFRSLPDIDRPGVRVVVNPGGTNAEFAADNLKQATVIEHPDNNTIFGEISGGNADAMITDASEIRFQTAQDHTLCPVSIDQPFTFEQKAYLLPATATDTARWVDQWLNIAQHDGTYDRISQKWLGRVIGP
ncbi:transporter substrate-binding domain-containing protein [Mycolicibacterium goodii]|nr:transporter substrate-binding domain-containing protein [Mycolicibacterium goodii]ULN44992.1 transporter substrate-binding domain-containing protein [Mycolicibacterium goodii]